MVRPPRLVDREISNPARTCETCENVSLFCPGKGDFREKNLSPHVIGDLLDPGGLCFHQLQQQSHLMTPRRAAPRPRRPTPAPSSPSGFHWRPGFLPSSSTCGDRHERSRAKAPGAKGAQRLTVSPLS